MGQYTSVVAVVNYLDTANVETLNAYLRAGHPTGQLKQLPGEAYIYHGEFNYLDAAALVGVFQSLPWREGAQLMCMNENDDVFTVCTVEEQGDE